MAEEIDKINEIFRVHDENMAKNAEEPVTDAQELPAAQEPTAPRKENTHRERAVAPKGVDKFLLDETGNELHNYTGDQVSERDYHPVRQSHEYRSGCLGGIMYFVFIMCVSVVLACVAWMAASDVLALNKQSFTATVVLPADIFSSETVDVLDEDGNKTGTERITTANMDYVAAELKDAGLIEYEWLFKAFCKVAHADRKVDPGEYELRSSFDYGALVRHMRANSESALTVKVVLPEGFTMHQIFQRLEENGVCSYEDLMKSAANDKFGYSFFAGRELGNAADLEGYLFPDTYEFYVNMQASSAINKFLQTFSSKLTADMENQAQSLGRSMREILTIASLIEKEAANDEEREIIASVIYNRLNAGMQLGIDASILYVHPDHEGAPTAEMLAEDDPYNTRLYTGLPPTPICSPGMNSINAALNPASTNYYYYALDTETGTHRFFNSSAEHAAFVATQNYD